MGAMGAELLAPQPPSGCITADLDGRAIPRFQVCLIASKRMLEFTRQVSFAHQGGGHECAWNVDAIHTVITEATVKDRQRCDGRELRR